MPTFTASRASSVVTIAANELGNVSTLRVTSATTLGAQLTAILASVNQPDLDTPAYRLNARPEALRITTAEGQLDLPWRAVTAIAAAI